MRFLKRYANIDQLKASMKQIIPDCALLTVRP